MSYFSMHNHTEYSYKDGLGHVEEMLERASEIGLSGIAFTEHGNVASAPYACKAKSKFPDLKIVYGVEFYECFNMAEKDPNNKYFHLIALAKNECGRIGINKLITQSEFEGKYFKPRVDLDTMKPYANDLIISSACLASKLSKEISYEKCIEYISEYKSIFPHFYLEMQSHSHIEQAQYNKKILNLARDTQTPFIITTDSHAPTKEMLKYQGRHVQIAQDAETTSENYEGCYLQTNEEIHRIMDSQIGYENVCVGLDETNRILSIIEDVNVPFQEPKLPPFPIPHPFKNSDDYIKYLSQEGWKKRNIDSLSPKEIAERKERLEYELSVISNMGFNGYFLIIWDAIRWGKENGIEFNRGRGSGAGSLVCYLLEITDVDPIKYGLIFERFLNPERIGLPDIDTDVHPKDKLIDYLKSKYGNMRVCQVMNFSYITPIVAIKDVARVLDRDEEYTEKFGKIGSKNADKISKLFTEETFAECLSVNGSEIEKHYGGEKYKLLFEIASFISGRIRHISTHAGGVGIVETEINEYMPMTLTADGEQVIQVDKKIIEDIGIVKFDFLGLKTLGIIKEAKELIGLTDWDLDPNNEIFINDKNTYQLLQSGKTNCVFQIESQGMKDLIVRLQPNNLEELCAVLALYRPDTMDVLEDYVNRKNGKSEITYIHDDMKSIYKSTYGCMVYQEQMMEVVRVFGGRTYGGADKFRKGIGKKDKALVRAEAEKLYNEIIKNGYPESIAKKISNTMASKGGYSFNKSHSLSYAVTTFTTAYLKANYPVEFFCAVLNSVYKDNGKVNKYILEAQDFDVEVLPPHINKSKSEFTVVDGKILFGLSSITNIGDNVVELLIEERTVNGKFTDLSNLLERIKLNKKQVVFLIKSGALPTKNKRNMLISYAISSVDSKEYPEYKEVKSLPSLIELQTKWNIDTSVVKAKEERLLLYNEARQNEHYTSKKKEWDATQEEKKEQAINDFKEKYMQDESFWEFEALSIFLKNNPFKDYQKYITQDFYEVENGMECIIVGIISSIQKKKDRNKKDYAYVRVYESNGLLEGLCWNSVYTKYLDYIKKSEKLAFYGEKNSDDTFIILKIKTIDDWINDRRLELGGISYGN